MQLVYCVYTVHFWSDSEFHQKDETWTISKSLEHVVLCGFYQGWGKGDKVPLDVFWVIFPVWPFDQCDSKQSLVEILWWSPMWWRPRPRPRMYKTKDSWELNWFYCKSDQLQNLAQGAQMQGGGGLVASLCFVHFILYFSNFFQIWTAALDHVHQILCPRIGRTTGAAVGHREGEDDWSVFVIKPWDCRDAFQVDGCICDIALVHLGTLAFCAQILRLLFQRCPWLRRYSKQTFKTRQWREMINYAGMVRR